MTGRKGAASLVLIALAACSEAPHDDGYPALIPLDPALLTTEADGQTVADLAARAARLKSRAAALRTAP